MAARSRMVSIDEELGKRDDDFLPSQRSRSHSTTPVTSTSTVLPWRWRWRKRRLFIAVVGIAALYFFFFSSINNTLPAGSTVSEDPTVHHTHPISYIPTIPSRFPREPAGAPPREGSEEDEDERSKHYYNGVVRFYNLATTLHRISRTGGSLSQNRNVLFVAASLKSWANLIPMACEMARIDGNYVHMALFGRSTLPMDELLEINGVDVQSCTVFWHDARGDFAEYSSDARAESATRGAMKHINDFMHPQAVIMDDGIKEELFFTRAMRIKAKELGHALIEIPSGKYEDFLWMTRLEANSLANWFIPNIDIVIQAPRASSGSLIRLVKSLVNADFRGLKVPRLTIELPSDIEHYAQKFLHDLQWPPIHDSVLPPSHANLLTLHHRIPSSRQSSEQASLRFVESFYPTRPESHHLLILSPQAELSPRFFQYLHYQILEHRHSSWISSSAQSLLGISLNIPSTSLNGTSGFIPPVQTTTINEETASSPFLYQAPSSSATLFFGDKWAQFHAFLSKRLQVPAKGKKTVKLVSETEPAWMEYLLELMRARDWTVLYPASSTMNFVTIHHELAQIPEEFTRLKGGNFIKTHNSVEKTDEDNDDDDDDDDDDEGERFLLSDEPPSIYLATDRVEKDSYGQNDGVPLHLLLQPEIERMPLLGFDGGLVTRLEMNSAGMEFREEFRRELGGCEADRAVIFRGGEDEVGAGDLFCLSGGGGDGG